MKNTAVHMHYAPCHSSARQLAATEKCLPNPFHPFALTSNVHVSRNKSLLISGAFNAVESVPTVSASVKTSPPWKTKLLCVLKRGVKRVARQGFKNQLWLGEVPGYPMEHLPVVISEVDQCVCVCGKDTTYEEGRE